MDNGKLTADVARKLSKKFGTRAEILFDHGDPEKDGKDQVGVIRSWFGDKLARDFLLADVDIAVVLPNSNQVLALVEIEESSASPKTLLGDVFATLFGDHIIFQGKRELLVDERTTLIVLSRGGSRQVITHLNKILASQQNEQTKNSCIHRIIIDTFDKSNLEQKLTRVIEDAIANQQSKIKN